MDNKKNEEELAKAIQSGALHLYPISELGINENEISVDPDEWYRQMYELYKDSCHRSDSLDSRQSLENHSNVIGQDRFACLGRVGFFNWYAVSLYYDKNIHSMDDEKNSYNLHHQLTMADEIMDGPGESLSKAINNQDDLVNYFLNPVIANTSDIFSNTDMHLRDMEYHLRKFMGLAIFPEKDVFTKDGGTITFNKDVYQGKDVVLPFIYATTRTLELFGRFAKKIANTGANTVVGIFATRIVPSFDGRDGNIDDENRVRSFRPRFRLNLGGLMDRLGIDPS